VNFKFIIVWILTWVVSGYLSTFITPVIVGIVGPLGSLATIIIPPIVMLLVWYNFTKRYAGTEAP